MKIIIVEDDTIIRKKLALLLEKEGYQTVLIENFENVIQMLKETEADLILLDINLPYLDGFEICKRIKKESHIPVIFVTSRNTDKDELLSIKSGGIDFIVKPYNKAILLEKIKRAINNNNPINYKEITKNGYTLDLHLSILKYQGKEVELTRNEFRILYYFFTEKQRIITKEELLQHLWNDKYYLDESILIVNINRLRTKAKEIGIDNLIKTVRGKGYRL